jgi:hypothetical protein
MRATSFISGAVLALVLVVQVEAQVPTEPP